MQDKSTKNSLLTENEQEKNMEWAVNYIIGVMQKANEKPEKE